MHVSAVDKGLCFASIALPPLGSVQSGLVLIAGMAGIDKGVLARYALGLKLASASKSNLGDKSSACQVNASSSQVLGIWPLRVTYTNPASISSLLQRHSVERDRQPR